MERKLLLREPRTGVVDGGADVKVLEGNVPRKVVGCGGVVMKEANAAGARVVVGRRVVDRIACSRRVLGRDGNEVGDVWGPGGTTL